MVDGRRDASGPASAAGAAADAAPSEPLDEWASTSQARASTSYSPDGVRSPWKVEVLTERVEHGSCLRDQSRIDRTKRSLAFAVTPLVTLCPKQSVPAAPHFYLKYLWGCTCVLTALCLVGVCEPSSAKSGARFLHIQVQLQAIIRKHSFWALVKVHLDR